MMIIGFGNEFRHDDAIGLIAARRLQQMHIAAEEHDRDFVSLIHRWKGIDVVILIDAVSSGARPGTLHRIDLNKRILPPGISASTHALGLAEAVEMSRTLGTLPDRILFLGIEGEDFTPGLGISAEVQRALDDLVQKVKAFQEVTNH